jgi:capsular exopolysaccharide synthesis family protein
MAQAGYSIVVVDADLRRPSQHRIFDVPNERGLTTLLARPDREWRSVAVDVIPNLVVVPSGPLPPNPADLLSSDRLTQFFAEMAQSVDIVLIDTPPVLVVSDPLVVAAHTDAVVLVARAGRTRIEALRRATESLRQGSARLVGIVLNQQTGRGAGDYYYYSGSYYGPSDKGDKGRPGQPASAEPAKSTARRLPAP